MSNRPQDKHLIHFSDMPPDRARAIRSAGGKARQEQIRQRRALAEILSFYADLPIRDERVRKRLLNLGFDTDDLTQKLLVADAVVRAAQGGNTYAIRLYLDLLGESGCEIAKENNLLDAIKDSTQGDMDTSDLPEVQQAEPG